ncbi:MAG: iron chelate uptake ABC transporter family permease subunit, partial [Acetivibrio ethanolgignens]
MQWNKKVRYIAAFLFLVLGVVLFFSLNICIGSVEIPLSDIGKSIAGQKMDKTMERILWDIRLPRASAAMVLGGALALAGYLLQTFFHNPIAGPFVLGISSGAKMIVAGVMVFLMERAITVSSVVLIIAAFLGAMISMG